MVEPDVGRTAGSWWKTPGKERLIKVIDTITRAVDLDAKFCFFIDGLDEYEGFDREIAATISNLASSPSVKICVASRPHNIFVSEFGGASERMLDVHKFTDRDIRQYIKDVLEENPAFASEAGRPWRLSRVSRVHS
jgi:hypothetical protein